MVLGGTLSNRTVGLTASQLPSASGFCTCETAAANKIPRGKEVESGTFREHATKPKTVEADETVTAKNRTSGRDRDSQEQQMRTKRARLTMARCGHLLCFHEMEVL